MVAAERRSTAATGGWRPFAPRSLGLRVVANRVAAVVFRRWRVAVHHVFAPAARGPGERRPTATRAQAARRPRHRKPGRPDILRRVLLGVHHRPDSARRAGRLVRRRGRPGDAAPVDEPEAARQPGGRGGTPERDRRGTVPVAVLGNDAAGQTAGKRGAAATAAAARRGVQHGQSSSAESERTVVSRPVRRASPVVSRGVRGPGHRVGGARRPHVVPVLRRGHAQAHHCLLHRLGTGLAGDQEGRAHRVRGHVRRCHAGGHRHRHDARTLR